MKLEDFMTATISSIDSATNRDGGPLVNDVGTHGKVLGAEELRELFIIAPACRVALIGSRGGVSVTSRSTAPRAPLSRADTGVFRGPLQMIAFLIEKSGFAGQSARDKVIILADEFMYWLEHQTFGLLTEEAGPALVTGFDIIYSVDIDKQGAAIAAVTWEQEVFFGRDLHAEDEALLTGDQYGVYPSGHVHYPEGEWIDKGTIIPDVGPYVRATVTKHHTQVEQPEEEDHTQIDVEDKGVETTGHEE